MNLDLKEIQLRIKSDSIHFCCVHVMLLKDVGVTHTHCWACKWMLLWFVRVCAHGSGSWLMCCSVLVSIHASNQTTTQTQWKVKKTLHPSHCPPVWMSVSHAQPLTVVFLSFSTSLFPLCPTCMLTCAHTICPHHPEHIHGNVSWFPSSPFNLYGKLLHTIWFHTIWSHLMLKAF